MSCELYTQSSREPCPPDAACSPGLDAEGVQPVLIPTPTSQVPMKLLAFLSLLALALQEARTASLPKQEPERREEGLRGEGDLSTVLPLGNYGLSLDSYDEVIDLSSYEQLPDYGDQLPEVRSTHSLQETGSQGSGPSLPAHHAHVPTTSSFSRRWKFSSLQRNLDDTKTEDDRPSISLFICSKFDATSLRSHSSLPLPSGTTSSRSSLAWELALSSDSP